MPQSCRQSAELTELIRIGTAARSLAAAVTLSHTCRECTGVDSFMIARSSSSRVLCCCALPISASHAWQQLAVHAGQTAKGMGECERWWGTAHLHVSPHHLQNPSGEDAQHDLTHAPVHLVVLSVAVSFCSHRCLSSNQQ